MGKTILPISYNLRSEQKRQNKEGLFIKNGHQTIIL